MFIGSVHIYTKRAYSLKTYMFVERGKRLAVKHIHRRRHPLFFGRLPMQSFLMFRPMFAVFVYRKLRNTFLCFRLLKNLAVTNRSATLFYQEDEDAVRLFSVSVSVSSQQQQQQQRASMTIAGCQKKLICVCISCLEIRTVGAKAGDSRPAASSGRSSLRAVSTTSN